MQHLPLVSVELQPVAAAFRESARELTAARRTVAATSALGVGPTSTAAAVETGMRDLLQLLDRLEATATGCVQALDRYQAAPDDTSGQP